MSAELTIRTSVKLKRDVTESPGPTCFNGIVEPWVSVMNTVSSPLCTTYRFSSGSPVRLNLIFSCIMNVCLPILNKYDPEGMVSISVCLQSVKNTGFSKFPNTLKFN